MIVVKKINNNVAMCMDGNHKELIAFGKGIGFPEMPYEITDLSMIDRTFYNVGEQYLALLNEIPFEIIDFTSKMLDYYKNDLPYTLNPNVIMTLSDHIAFAIQRCKNGTFVKMPLAYDLEQHYIQEMQVAQKIWEHIKKDLHISLPKMEIAGIAMHFVNNSLDEIADESKADLSAVELDEILAHTTEIIEKEMGFSVSGNTFSYTRYASHVHYLLERLYGNKHIDSENLKLYHSVREEYPKVAACVNKIAEYYGGKLHLELTEEEKLYLMLHVNRVCQKEAL